MVIKKVFFEKVDFEKKSADDKKAEINPSVKTVLKKHTGVHTSATSLSHSHKAALTLKAPITTAADDKFCDICPNL